MTVDSCIVGANGNSGEDNAWPPGFRFHPTDEELVLYYLKRKICKRKIKLSIIRDLDVYKWDPEELPGQSLLKTGDRQWFFFTPRDRKYPNAARSNRATEQGYWKATGKDRNIMCNSRNVGVKKTLVFYRGRAPSGKRTDWVMHEYTMDEQEFNRCPNVQDYYALYKVFKKSGPGPKNGEQYGAPFNEEEWADDECAELTTSVTGDSFAKQLVEVASDDNDKFVLPVEETVDEFDELLKQVQDAPKLDLPPLTDNPYSGAQVCDGQMQSTVVGSLLTEVTFPEPIGMLPASGPDHETEASLDFSHATAFMLPPDGTPVVMSADNNYEATPQLIVEDYLEMDDLIDFQPMLANIHGSRESLQFDSFEENNDLDIYHDADLFLCDLIDEQSLPHLNVNPLVNEMENAVGCQLQPYSATNHGITGFQSHTVASEADYYLQLEEAFVEEHIANQQTMHDQAGGVFSSPTSIDGTQSQLSPGVEGEVYSSLPGADQNVGEQDVGASSSRFASSMWALLDSIPSNPATAAENPLVNKALERMSSFNMLRMNAKVPNVIAGGGSAKKASLNRGFLFLSICGALCAILWLFLNGSLKVYLGRSIS